MGGDVSEQLRDCLRRFPEIRLAILFGSVAASDARADSDLDIAVSGAQTLTALERIELIEALALATGRAVDLVDLATVGEPLLGEILTGGVRILGTDEDHARLVTRHLIDAADFLPIRNRILAERRRAWIGK